MANSILIPVAIGELYDKLTILEIKSERIKDTAKLKNVVIELAALRSIARSLEIDGVKEAIELICDLKRVNEAIWDAENLVRDYERRGNFDADFVKIARSTYGNNDQRAGLKRALSLLGNSTLLEEKSHEV